MHVELVTNSPALQAKQAERPTNITEPGTNLMERWAKPTEQCANLTELSTNLIERRTYMTERQANMTVFQVKRAVRHTNLTEPGANPLELYTNLKELVTKLIELRTHMTERQANMTVYQAKQAEHPQFFLFGNLFGDAGWFCRDARSCVSTALRLYAIHRFPRDHQFITIPSSSINQVLH